MRGHRLLSDRGGRRSLTRHQKVREIPPGLGWAQVHEAAHSRAVDLANYVQQAGSQLSMHVPIDHPRWRADQAASATRLLQPMQAATSPDGQEDGPACDASTSIGERVSAPGSAIPGRLVRAPPAARRRPQPLCRLMVRLMGRAEEQAWKPHEYWTCGGRSLRQDTPSSRFGRFPSSLPAPKAVPFAPRPRDPTGHESVGHAHAQRSLPAGEPSGRRSHAGLAGRADADRIRGQGRRDFHAGPRSIGASV